MSENNTEVWAELERLSRRMARIEIALTERILVLEAEVKALKASRSDGSGSDAQASNSRAVYQDARSIEWRDSEAGARAIAEIMQR